MVDLWRHLNWRVILSQIVLYIAYLNRILMPNLNCRNVVTGAHYHFVSRWTSSTAYIAASLVMMVFVSKDTNRKIRTTFYIDYCVWNLVQIPSKTCTAPFVHGSHRLILHLCLLHCCWNPFWNHRCIWTRFF